MNIRRPLTVPRGFTLIEALIALVVVSLGLLALAGMQLNLSRGADFAKQRTEAMRIAQERIENLRSYSGISTGAINWNGLGSLANTAPPSGSNTSFTTTTSLGGATTDMMRPASVTVAWTDRTGAAQSVTLTTVISRTDLKDVGFLTEPLPLNTPLKRPKNRHINIPIPAKELPNGTESFYQFNANYVVVFSNVSGYVVRVCNPGVDNATIAQVGVATCRDVTGYVVTGYIYNSTANSAIPTGVDMSGITRNTALYGEAVTCDFGVAEDQNSGAAIANYKYYICVIPLDTPFMWSGTVKLAGVPITGNYYVCRYQYTQTAITANERNVQPYSNVNMSIDEQNYVIVDSSSGSSPSCPSSMTMSGVSTGVVHQNCRTSNANRAAECPSVAVMPL